MQASRARQPLAASLRVGDVAVVGAAEGRPVGEVAGVRVEGQGGDLVDGADQHSWQVPVHLVVGDVDRQDLPAMAAAVRQPDSVDVGIERDL